MALLLVAVCWCRRNKYKPPKWTFFRILHQDRVHNTIQCHDNNISKQMFIKKYLIVLRPIFDTTYKVKNRPKYTCELYITNWSYSNKVGIVFAMYQRMILKGKSWAVTCLLRSMRRRCTRVLLLMLHAIHITREALFFEIFFWWAF